VKDVIGETVYGPPNWKAFLVLGAACAFDALLIVGVFWLLHFLRAHGIL
jgi:hypothetical protein